MASFFAAFTASSQQRLGLVRVLVAQVHRASSSRYSTFRRRRSLDPGCPRGCRPRPPPASGSSPAMPSVGSSSGTFTSARSGALTSSRFGALTSSFAALVGRRGGRLLGRLRFGLRLGRLALAAGDQRDGGSDPHERGRGAAHRVTRAWSLLEASRGESSCPRRPRSRAHRHILWPQPQPPRRVPRDGFHRHTAPRPSLASVLRSRRPWRCSCVRWLLAALVLGVGSPGRGSSPGPRFAERWSEPGLAATHAELAREASEAGRFEDALVRLRACAGPDNPRSRPSTEERRGEGRPPRPGARSASRRKLPPGRATTSRSSTTRPPPSTPTAWTVLGHLALSKVGPPPWPGTRPPRRWTRSPSPRSRPSATAPGRRRRPWRAARDAFERAIAKDPTTARPTSAWPGSRWRVRTLRGRHSPRRRRRPGRQLRRAHDALAAPWPSRASRRPPPARSRPRRASISRQPRRPRSARPGPARGGRAAPRPRPPSPPPLPRDRILGWPRHSASLAPARSGYAAAFVTLEPVMSRDPDAIMAWFTGADAAERSGRAEEAMIAYDRVTKITTPSGGVSKEVVDDLQAAQRRSSRRSRRSARSRSPRLAPRRPSAAPARRGRSPPRPRSRH